LDRFYIGVRAVVVPSITDNLAAQLRVVLAVAAVQVFLMDSHVDRQVVIHQVAWAVDRH
jgi:hypothetical protein